MEKTPVLIVYYSFSNQTHRLVCALEEAFLALGIECVKERLRALDPIPFPVSSISKTISLMLKTLFRMRVSVGPLSKEALQCHPKLIVLAGPTWSFNPSGPVLHFLDSYGNRLLKGAQVKPIISCRSYWRWHYHYLKRQIQGCGGTCLEPLVFKHLEKEPWKTLGVFLTIAGKNPKSVPILRHHYSHYGHTRTQIEQARAAALSILNEAGVLV